MFSLLIIYFVFGWTYEFSSISGVVTIWKSTYLYNFCNNGCRWKFTRDVFSLTFFIINDLFHDKNVIRNSNQSSPPIKRAVALWWKFTPEYMEENNAVTVRTLKFETRLMEVKRQLVYTFYTNITLSMEEEKIEV